MFRECSHISADRIYATNENRKYCTKNNIQTNFCRKGAGKDDKPTKKIKEILNKQRSTSLESDRRSGKFWDRERALLTQ
jgi:hypothetical protein